MRKRSRNASAPAAAGSFTDRADDVSHGYGRPSGCAMRGSAPSATMVVDFGVSIVGSGRPLVSTDTFIKYEFTSDVHTRSEGLTTTTSTMVRDWRSSARYCQIWDKITHDFCKLRFLELLSLQMKAFLILALSGASSALSVCIRPYLSVSRVAPPRMALFDRFRRSTSDGGKTAAKVIAEEVAESKWEVEKEAERAERLRVESEAEDFPKWAAKPTEVEREAERVERLRVEREAADFFRGEAVDRAEEEEAKRRTALENAVPVSPVSSLAVSVAKDETTVDKAVAETTEALAALAGATFGALSALGAAAMAATSDNNEGKAESKEGAPKRSKTEVQAETKTKPKPTPKVEVKRVVKPKPKVMRSPQQPARRSSLTPQTATTKRRPSTIAVPNESTQTGAAIPVVGLVLAALMIFNGAEVPPMTMAPSAPTRAQIAQKPSPAVKKEAVAHNPAPAAKKEAPAVAKKEAVAPKPAATELSTEDALKILSKYK